MGSFWVRNLFHLSVFKYLAPQLGALFHPFRTVWNCPGFQLFSKSMDLAVLPPRPPFPLVQCNPGINIAVFSAAWEFNLKHVRSRHHCSISSPPRASVNITHKAVANGDVAPIKLALLLRKLTHARTWWLLQWVVMFPRSHLQTVSDLLLVCTVDSRTHTLFRILCIEVSLKTPCMHIGTFTSIGKSHLVSTVTSFL